VNGRLRHASLESGIAGYSGPSFLNSVKASCGQIERRGTSAMVTLVIGGARSGKSRFAQSLGTDFSHVVYVAPLRAEDPEMEARVAQHRRDRPAHWITVEEPLEIASAVERHRDADCILVDCLTLWLSNLCWEYRAENGSIEGVAMAQIARVAVVPAARVVLVTNEVGYGIVPESPVARFFRDLQGRVNQEAARIAREVIQVVAGIPVVIKRSEVGP
jgi:adenosylcobinamide kinase / adenosylcobinamide-phosphate guanylyltransferase